MEAFLAFESHERGKVTNMADSETHQAVVAADAILPPGTRPAGLTAAGQAALDAAQTLAQHAAAPATLRAYKADRGHFAARAR